MDTFAMVAGGALLLAFDVVLVLYFAASMMSDSPSATPPVWVRWIALPFIAQAFGLLMLVMLLDRFAGWRRRRQHR